MKLAFYGFLILLAGFYACDYQNPAKDEVEVKYKGDQPVEGATITFQDPVGREDKEEDDLAEQPRKPPVIVVEGEVPVKLNDGKPFTRISGWVLDPNGEPQAAHLQVDPVGGAIFTRDGRFVLDVAIRPDTVYTVRATTADGKFKGEVRVLAVKEGETPADIILKPVGEVGFLVRVVDPNGNPISGVLVGIQGILLSNLTDVDGKVKLVSQELIVRHEYVLHISKLGFLAVDKAGKATAELQPVTIVLIPE